MKVEVKEQAKFQPIELTITIENEQELCSLWHRINLGNSAVNSYSKGLKYEAEKNHNLWQSLNKLVEANNLKKY